MPKINPPIGPLNVILQPKKLTKAVKYLPAIYSPTMESGNFQEFMAQVKNLYGDLSLKQIIRFVKDKFVNEGGDSRVYTLRGIKKYLLLIRKRNANPTNKLEPLNYKYYGHNFGQPVARAGSEVKIILKAEGKPFSVKNWISYLHGDKKITPKQSETFIKDLERLSNFPQESFDDLAKRIKFVYVDCQKAIDPINPNNFLIDFKKKNINFVDIGAICNTDRDHNTVYDLMYFPLTDYRLRYDYFGVFSHEQKQVYNKCAKTIEKKCKEAYNKHRLDDISTALENLNRSYSW